jgi:toxin CptA
MTSAPAIGFEYRPSPGYRVVLIAVSAMAVLAVSLSALSGWITIPLSLAVLLAAALAVRRIGQSPIAAAGWGADESWTLHLKSHEDVPATLASFRVLGALVLLRLKTARHGTHTLLLAPDNADADIRRRLRMRLATVQPDESSEGA